MRQNFNKIALVDPGLFLYEINPTERTDFVTKQNAAINSIANALEGMADVRVFPSDYSAKTNKKLLKSCLNEIKNFNPDLIGLSCFSDNFYEAAGISSYLREETDALIVAGGNHFKFDIPPISDTLDPVRHALMIKTGNDSYGIDVEGKPVFGAVVVGNAQPLIDIVSSGFDRLNPPEGMYTFDDHLIGKGKGRLPKNSSPIYSFTLRETSLFMNILLGKSLCPNICDYCSLEGLSYKGDTSEFLPIIQKNNVSNIWLNDSTPWFYKDYFAKQIKTLRQENVTVPMGSYMDPMCLVNDDTLLDLFVELNINSFYCGREVACEETAHLLGRKYKGHIRTQAMLDAEKIEISKLIRQANDAGGSVQVAYILAPFDTLENINKTLDEMEYFVSIGGKISPNLLSPYPGTNIRRRYHDLITDASDFIALNSGDSSALRWSDPKVDYLGMICGKGSITKEYFPLFRDIVSGLYES